MKTNHSMRVITLFHELLHLDPSYDSSFGVPINPLQEPFQQIQGNFHIEHSLDLEAKRLYDEKLRLVKSLMRKYDLNL